MKKLTLGYMHKKKLLGIFFRIRAFVTVEIIRYIT